MTPASQYRLLRLPQVQELFPVSQATIYNKIKDGTFPAPHKIGRSSFWKLTEVEDFLKDALET
jgi:predicted DNA-binding transcriptional regulator AlpA